LNVAHQEIDLARPRENRFNPGFSDEERASFSELLESGFVDTFRHFHPDLEGAYSWWSYRAGARPRNVGWRIDYFGVSTPFIQRVVSAEILPQVLGSDHCPVGIVLG
jgi:exodeoxyribonuclease-3